MTDFNKKAVRFLKSELGLKHLKMRKITSRYIKPKTQKRVALKSNF